MGTLGQDAGIVGTLGQDAEIVEVPLWKPPLAGTTQARHWDNRPLTMETSAIMVDWDSGSSPIMVDAASGYTCARHWDRGSHSETNPIMVDWDSGYGQDTGIMEMPLWKTSSSGYTWTGS